MNILYLFLTLAALATALWYVAFSEPSTPGATYQDTYACISIGAALIFGGLFLANFTSRKKMKPNHLLDR